ncbi:MAG: hypothetical protein PF518_19785 [Spirochaetaceae bacterium]|jgi:hypothetical protein|nr:hypothetical protein [Spirochaetaceae bacterium]
MIYQQEIKEIESFYSNYKDKKIVYTKEITQLIGLVQKNTAIKVGSETINGALISSTMESLVVMAKLSEAIKQHIYDLNGILSVQLRFISRETGKPILFNLHTKILNMNDQGQDQKDLQFITMQIRRKIPNDLIRIFGLYIEEERKKLLLKKKKVECSLLSRGEKKDCIAESIDKSVLTLVLKDDPDLNMNDKVMAVLKIVQTDEIIEIIGSISKKIIESDSQCQLFVNFIMEEQSPRFSYSVHVLKNLINT